MKRALKKGYEQMPGSTSCSASNNSMERAAMQVHRGKTFGLREMPLSGKKQVPWERKRINYSD